MTTNKEEIKFCMFILSHGRPDKIYTLNSLKKAGYTGDYYIVIDNEDKTSEEYYKNFGDKVLIFNKKEIAETFDTADNFDNRKTIVYARNACFKLAEELGYTHFMELDDDYTSFSYRFDLEGEFRHNNVRDLDLIIDKMIRFYEKANITCLAFAQGGDYIGGAKGLGSKVRTRRKAMNTLLCSTKRPFTFLGRINEDVNTYVREGQVGKLFLTINNISINQKQTQSNSGGMTDVYLESGTYLKSFYTIMFSPSSVVLTKMGNINKRIHHKVKWRYAVPQIIDEKYKKK